MQTYISIFCLLKIYSKWSSNSNREVHPFAQASAMNVKCFNSNNIMLLQSRYLSMIFIIFLWLITLNHQPLSFVCIEIINKNMSNQQTITTINRRSSEDTTLNFLYTTTEYYLTAGKQISEITNLTELLQKCYHFETANKKSAFGQKLSDSQRELVNWQAKVSLCIVIQKLWLNWILLNCLGFGHFTEQFRARFWSSYEI